MTKEEISMAAVHAAQSKLTAEAGELAEVYGTCEHAWVMVRETAIEELTETLHDGGKEEKEIALRELIGQVKHAHLRYLRDKSASGLGEVAVHDDKVRDAVMELLSEKDAGVREAAIVSLRQRLQSQRMVDALKESQRGMIDAFEAEKAMIAKIHELISDINGRVRFNAIDSLSTLVKHFHTESISGVISRLTDEEAWVRRHAAEMLCVALRDAQEVKKDMPRAMLVFIEEGYAELLFGTQSCYDIGLNVASGDGDIYLRQLAVMGLTSAAETESEQFLLNPVPEEFEAVTSDDENEFVGMAMPEEPKGNKRATGDMFSTLKKCLQDKDEGVRDLAAKALLRIAGTGYIKAVDGVMSDVECVLTNGLGVPGLGVKGTPEAAARGRLFGDDGMGTRNQKRRDREEQIAFDRAMEVEEQRRRDEVLMQDLNELKVLADNGFISKLREAAFPSEERRAEVLESEAAEPARLGIRVEAAQWLQKLSLQDNQKAAQAVAANLNEFMELTGKRELGKRAARIIRQQLKREVVPPPPKPQVELCDRLRDQLEIETRDDGGVSDKDREARKKAALELSKLAEEGDAAAAEVWLDEAASLLQGLFDAGVINQKSLKAVLGPPRSY